MGLALCNRCTEIYYLLNFNPSLLGGRAFTNDAVGCQIDLSWWTHWVIFCSIQCSTTSITKVIYAILWDGVYKNLAANWKE